VVYAFLGYQPFEPGKTFGETLQFLRRAAGLSQEKLAERTGFDESTIAKWERGDKFPLPANLERLRTFFDETGHQFPGFEAESSVHSARRAAAAVRAWNARRAGR